MFAKISKNRTLLFWLPSALFFLFLFIIPASVLAATVEVGQEFGEQIGLPATDPRIVIARIIQIILGFLGIIAVGLMIYGGFLWMTSAGSEEKISKAKKILVNTVIGLIIILSSFAIVTFVISSLLDATSGGDGSSSGNNTTAPGGGGIAALGACSMESIYPEDNQRNVPRNTSVILTFKEEVNLDTICSGPASNCLIRTDNVQIYKTKDESRLLTDVRARTGDNKTFLFTFGEYLGSPSENIWYTFHLLNGIETIDGEGVFDKCRNPFFKSQFEVDNRLDLSPPYIIEGGVTPAPDNLRDEASVSSNPLQATGAIAVHQPYSAYREATSSRAFIPASASAPAANISVHRHSEINGTLNIAVLSDGVTAQLSSGSSLLGSDRFSDGRVNFDQILTLTLPEDEEPVAGYAWSVEVFAERQADTITVGSNTYTFVRGTATGNQISLGTTDNATAANMAAIINNHSLVNAVADNNIVNITATSAGSEGNGIVLSSSASGLAITAMSGGSSAATRLDVQDAPDQPINSTIQIKFNEPIMPVNIVGNADDVSDYIRVVDLNGPDGNYLSGEFIISNSYRTIEFISDNQCGVNSCGEEIYCLPENSNLRVELQAASLETCSSNADCSAKAPYNTCGGGTCEDENGKKYPLANTFDFDGVMDYAFNSFDGNRDTNAVGPVSFYDANQPTLTDNGDNFRWSFFLNDRLDTSPPFIMTTTPGHGASTNINDPIDIRFNKLMMESSLKTGSTRVQTEGETVTHGNVNIWSSTGPAVGYWNIAYQIDDDADGVFDRTGLEIRHGMLADTTTYGAQVGSGVKDIYQNCFKPSDGPACTGENANSPSCCNGELVSEIGSDGTCSQ